MRPLTFSTRTALLHAVTIASLCAAISGCVRDVPGTTCDTSQDCYLGSICQQGTCTPGQDLDMKGVDLDSAPDNGMPIDQGDMLPDEGADLDLIPDADMTPRDMTDMPIDAPPDLPDMADMLDMADMPDLPPDMPIDMPPDMPPTPDNYTISTMSLLPGPRAALVQDNTVWVLTAENSTNTLNVSKLDPVTHLPTQSYPIASDLDWSVIDTTEHAALFSVDSIHIGILYEDHATPGKIKLFYTSLDIATGMNTTPTLVKETNNLDSPTIDFDLYGAVPHVLVNPAGAVSILALENDVWVEQTSIPLTSGVQLDDAHFITNQNAVCGHVNGSLACFMKLTNGNWSLLNNPKLEGVDELRVTSSHEHMVIIQGQNLSFGPITFDPNAPGQPVRFMRSQATRPQRIKNLSAQSSDGGAISVTYTSNNEVVLVDPLSTTPTPVVVTTAQDRSALTLFGSQPHVFTSDAPTSLETTLFLP